MRLLRIAAWLPVVALTAQEAPTIETATGHRLRVVPIAGVEAQAIVVVWPHRQDLGADERVLLAQATAAHRALAAEARGGAATTVEVLRDATVFAGLWSTAAPGAAAAWLAALAAPSLDPQRDADAIERQCARAALAADDAEWLYPGEVLTTLARRALGPGGGSVAFLQQQTIEALAQAAQAAPPAPLVVVLVGAAAESGPVAAGLERIPVLATATADAPPVAAVRVAAPVDQPHDRVDGAYAAAAGRLPADAEPLVLAVAVAVLRARAETRFRSYRGNEAGARAPFVRCEPLAGDDLWVCCRRAAGRQVEGPRRELDELLQTLRQEPVTAAEIEAAVAAVAAEWSVPPWPALQDVFAVLPVSLVPRARALALLLHRGVDDRSVAALRQCPPAAVQAVLAQIGDPERIVRAGLLPTTSNLWPEAPAGR